MGTRADKMLTFVAAFVVVMGLVRSAKADFTFGEPTNLGPMVNSAEMENGPGISADGLELYFASDREGGIGGIDLWIVTRPTINDAWEQAKNLGEIINSSKNEAHPTLSGDGLTLCFSSFREGGIGGNDLWITTRTTKNDPWDPPRNLGLPVNSPQMDSAPSLSFDGLCIYFDWYDQNLPEDDPRQGFYVARRETKDAPWGEPVSIGAEVNNWKGKWEPDISSDGNILLLADYWLSSPRPGGYGGEDIWLIRRANENSKWSEPLNLGPVINSAFHENGPSISVDGSMLYFISTRPGGLDELQGDIWQAPITPIVDLNGDGNVNTDDLVILINCWGTNEWLCDIGPTPLGDGVVDIEDLKVFIKYWEQENMPGDSQNN